MPWIQEPTLERGRRGFLDVATIGIWQDPTDKTQHVVPVGTETNLASIPWFLGWYIDKLGTSLLPAILHDYEYVHGDNRKEADRRFKVGILEQGMRENKAGVAHRTLRTVGGIAWRRGHKK